jgi:hypothetical protein
VVEGVEGVVELKTVCPQSREWRWVEGVSQKDSRGVVDMVEELWSWMMVVELRREL